MKILVTGGAGFIGSHVCQALVIHGHDVCVYDNFNDFYSPRFKNENVSQIKITSQEYNKKIDVIENDIRNAGALNECFSKNQFDAVIHLAACAGVRPSIENAPMYVDVNIQGTLNVLECLKKYNVKKFLFASSSSVYGNNEKVPFSENDFVDNPISPYAATKKSGELLCHTYHSLYGITAACLRFFTVYGPRQRPDLAIYKFTEKICLGQPLPFYGDGSMGRDFTYVNDTVKGVLLALDWIFNNENRYEIFNLGESYTVSLSDMVKTIEKTLCKTAVLSHLPVPPGDVKLTWADISKAGNILGYKPEFSFEQGITDFIQWFKKERLN